MSEPIHLRIERGTGAGRMLSIPANGATLGRAPMCDIALDDASLSRHHCRFFFRDGKLWISDLDSSNGSLVNGAPVTESRLRNDDLINIGEIAIRVMQDDRKQPLALRKEAQSEPEAPPIQRSQGGGAWWVRLPAWAMLLAWLTFLTYSLMQRPPPAGKPAVIKEETGSAGAPSPTPPSFTMPSPVEPSPDFPAEPRSRFRALSRAVAVCVVDEQYDRALQLLHGEMNSASGSPIRSEAESLDRLVRGALDSYMVIEDAMLKLSGKEVILEYKGQPVKAIPRALANERIVFAVETPAGRKLFAIRAREMSLRDRLRFLGDADTPEKSVMQCAWLIKAGRVVEARAVAARCGSLSEAFADLAGDG